ncbi:ATP-dependent nuclease [Sulfitobacter dubius]|uniref:ATP-dependent nuclease n=1 Tax=Sulfitobacter dubius TaxID=218673 RepID=UPI0022AF7804|nr:AAA family ATPase [Sulfitobacter dubius]MCZ4367688.1 AAA family ATPase [Sulfitobacter dubius]
MTKPIASLSSITFSDGQTFHLGRNEKLMLVGPNNSGKSLTLREVVTSAESQLGNFQRNKVVKGMSFEKTGDEEAFRAFLEESGTYDSQRQSYQVRDWTMNEGFVEHWFKQPMLWQSAEGFIKNIVAETRLNITGLQNSVSVGAQRTKPQQVLYDEQDLMERISRLFRRAFGDDLFFNFRGGASLPIHVGSRPIVEAGEDRVSDTYVAKVNSFPLLHEQGDGVKSFAGILFEAVATERDITLIDEPEAFLHPPQMRRLGETLAEEVRGQLLVATHSSDIMRGFLTGTSGAVRILRMQRNGDVNQVTEASIATIKTLWEQPDLRYSNALEGIFHEQTIICEDDSDCRLFNSIADHMEREAEENWKDTAYVPAGGKHSIHKIARVLGQIGVPVTGVFDIDFLSDAVLVKTTVEGFGGDWSIIEPLWRRVNAAVTAGVTPPTNTEIKQQIIARLTESGDDALPKGDIHELLKRGEPWAEVKKFGTRAIPNGKAQKDYATLIAALDNLSIVVVPVGEIENYAPEIGLHGPKFVTKLLQDIPLGDERLANLRSFVRHVHRQ